MSSSHEVILAGTVLFPRPKTSKPLRTLECGHKTAISLNREACPPPPCVQKGTIILSERSYSDKKEAMGGAIVLHQFGDQINIISYDSILLILLFNNGFLPASISFLASFTTSL